jgi:hypothetical protein
LWLISLLFNREGEEGAQRIAFRFVVGSAFMETRQSFSSVVAALLRLIRLCGYYLFYLTAKAKKAH